MAVTTRLTVYLPPEDKGDLATLAFLNRTSVSEYVGKVLAAHVGMARLTMEDELRGMAQARRRADESDALRMVLGDDGRTITAYRELHADE